MSKTPQVIVSLTAAGGLKVELPGIMATRRSIDLSNRGNSCGAETKAERMVELLEKMNKRHWKDSIQSLLETVFELGKSSRVEQTLLRILQAQQQDQTEIGLDGAPTGQQLKHWERHAVWPSSSCRFCLAEGRATAAEPKRRSRQLIVEHGDVQVRRIKAKEKGKAKPQVTKKLAGELGL